MDCDELEELLSNLSEMVNDSSPQAGYWGRVWALVKEINAGFRETRFPTPNDRSDVWNRFQGIVEQVKARSEESKKQREIKQHEWENRERDSRRAVDRINSRIQSATPFSGMDLSLVFLGPLKLIAALSLRLVGINTPDAMEETHQELRACNEALDKAWETFNEYKGQMLASDKNEAYANLQEARQKLNEAWERWKEAKSAYRSSKITFNIRKLQDNIEKSRAFLAKQEAHLEKLKDDYANGSGRFRERCATWIEECEALISKVESQIAEMEGWLEEENRKL
jgi:hypothetical protein